jgi:hypothetical protein
MLDDLAKEKTAFHELSMSRLGYGGDREIAKMILERLHLPREVRQESSTRSTVLAELIPVIDELATDQRYIRHW